MGVGGAVGALTVVGAWLDATLTEAGAQPTRKTPSQAALAM